jgi:hypothetical protein
MGKAKNKSIETMVLHQHGDDENEIRASYPKGTSSGRSTLSAKAPGMTERCWHVTPRR